MLRFFRIQSIASKNGDNVMKRLRLVDQVCPNILTPTGFLYLSLSTPQVDLKCEHTRQIGTGIQKLPSTPQYFGPSKLVYEECKGLFRKHNTGFLTGVTAFFGRFRKFPWRRRQHVG